jgi:hypothetical protein
VWQTRRSRVLNVPFYGNNLKILHVNPEVVSSVISSLKGIFGLDAPLTKTCSTKHNYLGMTLDYGTTGKVCVIMFDYVDSILAGLPANMDGKDPTPAASHLFAVSPMSREHQLNVATADLYHHNVAKLLFLCKRMRSKIQTAVAFLCTCMKSPNYEDYKKLTWVMRYLQATWNLPITLECKVWNRSSGELTPHLLCMTT